MSSSRDIGTTDALAVGGAVVTVVGAFLPWVTAGASVGPVEVSTSVPGIDMTLGLLTVVLAVIVVGVVLGLGWDETGAAAVTVAGLVVVAAGVLKLLDLGGIASAGIGLYLAILGGLGILAAGVMGYQSEGSR